MTKRKPHNRHGKTGWFIINRSRFGGIVRGPYEHDETAAEVRSELELSWNDCNGRRPDPRNLCLVECKTEKEYGQMVANLAANRQPQSI